MKLTLSNCVLSNPESSFMQNPGNSRDWHLSDFQFWSFLVIQWSQVVTQLDSKWDDLSYRAKLNNPTIKPLAENI